MHRKPETKPKHPFWRGRVLPRLALMVVPLPKRTFCSIDVTARCNLRCAHCYHFSHEQPDRPELSVEEWLRRIKEMQSEKPYFNCTWVGGEPLLRRELIEKGRTFFRSNRVVTNGTLPLPHWPDVEFHISVDGTEKIHDSIRGEGCYARIRKNVDDPGCEGLKIAIACCLNRLNVSCVEELLEDWRSHPHIRHVLFDFFTPMAGEDQSLWLSFAERDEIIDKIETLKRTYGDFIGGPPDTLSLMRGKNAHKAVGRKCVFNGHAAAFDAWGNVKKPCVMGPKADCMKCGCIVPFSLRAWKKPSNLLREIFKG